MNQHRIAIFLPSLRGGGAERVMVNLAKAFAKNNFQVDLVLAKAEGPYLSQISSDIRIVDLNASRVALSLFPLAKYLRKNKPFALISALNHANIIAILAAEISLTNTKILVTEHSTLSRSLLHHANVRTKLMPFLMKLFYPMADHVIAVSNGVADDLAKTLNLSQSKIKVIYNPVVTDDLFEKANEEVDHPWFQDKQHPVILAVGRLTEVKDYPTLIKAFYHVRQQREAKLVILGDGEKREELLNLIKDMGLEQDVDIIGFVQNPYAYMKRCSVFVLSSKWEGLPTVLVEALACGANVISTDCPSGPREILKNGKYGSLAKTGDDKGLAKEILKILDVGKQDEKVLTEAYQQFKSEFVFSKYLNLFN
ncbi:glycosyltransferase [Geobacillus thermoleovorans]|uniref:glycosyltransferase n=1 Tax=Geobacillus thermoleovorans TaxID=33941 RepID=UPI0016818594|nr:glycosyltransferase [Geobacillus thermoleovorans]QNU20466.1 glycosyltransferase [Geobacillus thermoleovorans]